ncbi:MAG: glucose/galactose MFS transporter [Cytophagales bacterium]|nr:glucose/galactose MFS transporter [Cytophagales bacterium]
MSRSKPNYVFPLIAMIVVFFLFGGITNINGILQPYLEKVFNLSSTQGALVPFTFFSGFVFCSPLGSKIVAKWNHKLALIAGLLGVSLGLVIFYSASVLTEGALTVGESIQLPLYLFFVGLFTVGSGVAILQVAANPYMAALGNPETADSRINMAGFFNSLASVIFPMLAGRILLDKSLIESIKNIEYSEIPTDTLTTMIHSVQMPYIAVIGFTLLVALIYKFVKLPELDSISADNNGTKESPLKYRHLKLGVLAIFCYVGSEVTIAQYLVKLAEQKQLTFLPSIIEITDVVAVYWSMLMVGRFAGIFIMQKVKINQGLIWTSFPALVLLILGLGMDNDITIISFILVGLFNSVMWGAIFPLGIAKMGSLTNKASSYMIMGIFGGAVLPVIQGALADIVGIHLSYTLLLATYGYLLYYGVAGHKVISSPENVAEKQVA